MNNKRAIYKFWILDFLFFKFTKWALFWSKISIFSIEISLELHLHTKYGWNNPNSCWLGLKSQKLYFLPFLAAQKFIIYTNIQIMSRAQFSLDFFLFLVLVTMLSIRINYNWTLFTDPVLCQTDQGSLGWMVVKVNWLRCFRSATASHRSIFWARYCSYCILWSFFPF